MRSSALQQSPIDASGIGLSVACIVHCLALPLMVSFGPAFAMLAEAEWLHKGLVMIAAPLFFLALAATAASGRRVSFALIGGIGIALLIAGAFVEALHDYETPLTVIGALALATAHLMRWRPHA